jgi:Nuclease-related domain/SEC-C motif
MVNLPKDLNYCQPNLLFRREIYLHMIQDCYRYQVHEKENLRELFLDHSNIINEIFGITSEQFIEEIYKIFDSLTYGLDKYLHDFLNLQNDLLSQASSFDQEGITSSNIKEITEIFFKNNDCEDRARKIFDCLFGDGLFNVQKVTLLPKSILDALSWKQGEDQDFFSEGDFKGWPLRIWPIFKRPFIFINGSYYCFDHTTMLDNLYRVMQKIILSRKPDYKNKWNKIQQEISENLPFKYLDKILPGSKKYQSIFYKLTIQEKNKSEWCELDGLLIYDDHLFVIEVKAGSFTYTSPANDFDAHIQSFKNLLLKPYLQGKRFIQYLNSSEKVDIFNALHQKIASISKNDFRHITICPITIDPFTEFAAQAQHLSKIGIDTGEEAIWPISINDLRVFADIFNNPLIFLHFVEQRMRASKSEFIQLDDEIDHIGLYLNHNNYSQYAKEMFDHKDSRINFFGYRQDIDHYFSDRLIEDNIPCRLTQDIPVRIREIVAFLSHTNKSKRTAISSFILDMEGECRTNISNYIDKELVNHSKIKRSLPLSIYGDVEFTLFCWSVDIVPRNKKLAIEHTRSVILANADSSRLLIELVYTASGKLNDFFWQNVDLLNLPEHELNALRTNALILKKKRIENAKSKLGKIGKKQPCPCGSGKKYYKCCLRRKNRNQIF